VWSGVYEFDEKASDLQSFCGRLDLSVRLDYLRIAQDVKAAWLVMMA